MYICRHYLCIYLFPADSVSLENSNRSTKRMRNSPVSQRGFFLSRVFGKTLMQIIHFGK